MRPGEEFQEGKSYTLSIWLAAKDDCRFQVDSSYEPDLTGTINGNLPPYIHRAYEQDPEQVVELIYTFTNTPKAQEHTHTISDWRITGIYHYRVCTTCGEFLEQEDHWGGVASCHEQGVCTACGYAYLPENEEHTPDTSKWVARVDWYHFHPCMYCGAHCDIEDHRWSPTYLYQDRNGHAWVCADCGGKSEVKPHTPGPAATETTPQTCKDCGYILNPAKNHTHTLNFLPDVAPTCMASGTVLGHMEYMKRQDRLYYEVLEGKHTQIYPHSSHEESIEFYDNHGMFYVRNRSAERQGFLCEPFRYDQVASYEPYLDEGEPSEPGKPKVFEECGVEITLVGETDDVGTLGKGLRAHPYATETIRICVNKWDKHIGTLEVNQIIVHFDYIFGVDDDTKGLFSFGPTKQQRREGEAFKAMAGMFGATIKAAKTGEVSEETAAQVEEAVKKVDDAATGGLAEYSRRADAAEDLVREQQFRPELHFGVN